MNQEFNLITAIKTILKWKWPILAVTIASGVIAAIFSVFIMDEWFLSWSTVYPTNQAMSDRNAIFSAEATAVDYFGDKSDVNRVLTIANSNPVINFIIDSFKLAEHYQVDTAKLYWKTIVRKKFEKKYEAIKTERDAVQISVYDTDPVLASAMVNTIVNKIDALNKAHINQSKLKIFTTIKSQILAMQERVNAYSDTLALLGEKYQIKVSSGTQESIIVDGSDYSAVQNYKTILAQQMGATKELNNLINIDGQMEVALKNNETSLYILEAAFPADRREKPVRSLIVLLTVLITAFVAVLSALLLEQIGEIRKQL